MVLTRKRVAPIHGVSRRCLMIVRRTRGDDCLTIFRHRRSEPYACLISNETGQPRRGVPGDPAGPYRFVT